MLEEAKPDVVEEETYEHVKEEQEQEQEEEGAGNATQSARFLTRDLLTI